MQDADERARLAREQQRAADIQLARLRAELEQAQHSARRTNAAATEELSDVQAQAADATREVEKLRGELEERTVQLSVLTDTIEALQVGSSSEKEQRVVNLTAELVASRMKEISLAHRAINLADKAAKAVKQASEAEQAAEAAAAERQFAAAAEAAMHRQHESTAAELKTLRHDVKQLALSQQALADDRDKAAAAQSAAESEVAGLQQGMQLATARHFEQLAKERSDARGRFALTAEGRWTGAGDLAEPEYVTRHRHQMAQLLQEVRSLDDEQGVERWQMDVVKRLQDMMLHAEAERSHAVVTSRIASEDLAATAALLHAAERARERALQASDAAAAQLAVHKQSAQLAQEASTQHAHERHAAQTRRIAALSEQLADCNARLCTATAELQTAKAGKEQLKSSTAELASALRSLQGQMDACIAERDGLQMELAGTPQVRGADRSAAVEARDARIRDYVSSRVLPLLQFGCVL
jgi:chromosome segregation ATPase